jgi:hypothetical protein
VSDNIIDGDILGVSYSLGVDDGGFKFGENILLFVFFLS